MSKSKFEVKGIEELIKALNNLDKSVKNKISKNAVDEASEIMLDSLKATAPRAEVDSKHSYAFLDKTVVKKGDGHQAKMGINSTNWDLTRGLWFHYWGFRSHGRDLWVDRAFDSSIDEAKAAMSMEIEKGIKSEW